MLNCALEDLQNWPGQVVIAPSEPSDVDWANSLLQREVIVIPQQNGNLGERINQIDNTLRARGTQKTIYIGSDAPILTHNEYLQISELLTNSDISLAPALDGGVTIMANSCLWPTLAALPWSSEYLGYQLEQLCCDRELSVTKIETTYDLDSIQQLSMLLEDLKLDNRPARQQLLIEIKKLFSLILDDKKTSYA